MLYFALGCIAGSFATVGLLVLAALYGEKRRAHRSARRRARHGDSSKLSTRRAA
jgi:hypothetical protein